MEVHKILLKRELPIIVDTKLDSVSRNMKRVQCFRCSSSAWIALYEYGDCEGLGAFFRNSYQSIRWMPHAMFLLDMPVTHAERQDF